MATPELSFGGKPFRVVTPAVAAVIGRLYPWDRTRDVQEPDPNGIGANTGLGELPHPSEIDQPPPDLCALLYPTGATRWATFRGLMGKDDKDAVVALAVPSDTNTALDLIIDDGTGLKNSPGDTDDLSRIKTKMYLLPPRPVIGVDGASDLWLITLVDERYYWRWRHSDTSGMSWPIRCEGSGGGGVGSGEGGGTGPLCWDPLFSKLATDLGITLDYDTYDIEPEYLSPSPDSPLYGARVQSAYAMEQAAQSVGRVVVRKFDGTFKLVPHAQATAKAEAARKASRKAAGGVLYPADPAASDKARAPAMPESVDVIFPQWIKETTQQGHYYDPVESPQGSSNDWPKGAHVINKTPGSLGSPYADWPKSSGKAVIQTTCKAVFLQTPPSGDPENLDDELVPAAERLAKDYLDACAANLDEAYSGVLAFDPEGACDMVVTWGEAGQLTRVRRGPLNRHVMFSWLGRDAYRLRICRVDPGEPRQDGVSPPEPELASWTILRPNLETMTLDDGGACWFWDLNIRVEAP